MSFCCSERTPIDFSKMAFPEVDIMWHDSAFWSAVLWIIVTPLFWLAAAQLEYSTRWLSWICGSSVRACYWLSGFILTISAYRIHCFRLCILDQPSWWFLRDNRILWFGHSLVVLGALLVLTSVWTLGWIHTFLGDYFGILLPERVKCFPYSRFTHPMYFGSTLCFLGYALGRASQTGLFLTALVCFMYKIAVMVESPVTDRIYSVAEDKRASDSLSLIEVENVGVESGAEADESGVEDDDEDEIPLLVDMALKRQHYEASVPSEIGIQDVTQEHPHDSEEVLPSQEETCRERNINTTLPQEELDLHS